MSVPEGNVGDHQEERPGRPDAGDSEHPRLVSSEELMQGRRELWIEHAGEIYRLRITSNGKLYLTK
jgi:hemin uptake protein HemP